MAQISCWSYGTQTNCSNGQSFQTYGNQTYDNRGNSWSTYGNQTYGSNGTTWLVDVRQPDVWLERKSMLDLWQPNLLQLS
jgi:hypothetical protein